MRALLSMLDKHGEKAMRYMANGMSRKRICPQPLAMPSMNLAILPLATNDESSVNIAVVMGMAKTEYGRMYQMRA